MAQRTTLSRLGGTPRVFTWLLFFVVLSSGCRPAASETAPEGDLAAVLNEAFSGRSGEWVDLTYAFSAETTYWPTASGFELDTVAWGVTEGGYFYSAFDFSSAEHGGTHLDAPIHFSAGKRATDEIPLDDLIGPAAVVDVSGAVGIGTETVQPDFQVGVEDLRDWESRHGAIPDGAILLLRTGWGTRYADRSAYLGTDRTGPDAVPELHFPGLSPEAARWLVDQRSIAALGIDTPSIDYGQSSLFETHQILYGADIPGFENVAQVEALPATGSFVVALPMKIAGGSGGPLRIVAFVPEGVQGGP